MSSLSFQLKKDSINIFGEKKSVSFSKGSFSMFLILGKDLGHFILNNFNFWVLVDLLRCRRESITRLGKEGLAMAMGGQGSGRRLGEIMAGSAP